MSDERFLQNPIEVKSPIRGAGLPIALNCMGCGLWKASLGSKGKGVRWRCAGCVEKRAAKCIAA